MSNALATYVAAALSLGPAVADGRIRYVSVSQIEKFDPSTRFGCPRKWHFRYVGRIPEPQKPAAKLGEQCHAQIEHYERTGEDVLGEIVRAGLRFIPRPGDDLLVEYAFARLEGDDVVSPLLAGDIPVVGKVDLLHSRGEWLTDEGELLAEPGMVEVVDWKTTKTIETTYDDEGFVRVRGWAKTAEEMAVTWQMRGYARLAATLHPEATLVRVGHGYFQTAGRRAAKKVSARVQPAAAIEAWDVPAAAIAAQMKAVALAEKVEDVEPNYAACSGCAYRAQCPRDPKMVLAALGGGKVMPTMSLVDKWKAREGAAAAPAPMAPEVKAEMARLEAEEAASAAKPPAAASITPPDAPAPKDIAQIPEPIAAATAEAAGLTPPGAPCPMGGVATKVDTDTAVAKKFACKCGSTLKIAPQKLDDGAYHALVPKHNAGEAAERKAKAAPKAKAAAVDAASTPVSTPTIPVIVPASDVGLVLLLDCREDGARAERLEAYADRIAAELAALEGAADIRCAPEKSSLAFGKWKGALASCAKASPPPEGIYEVASTSELAMVCFEALAPIARRVVRG